MCVCMPIIITLCPMKMLTSEQQKDASIFNVQVCHSAMSLKLRAQNVATTNSRETCIRDAASRKEFAPYGVETTGVRTGSLP
jgi:hypothetical protein